MSPREEFQHFILPDSLRSAKQFIVNMCARGDFLSSFFVAPCGLDSEGIGNLFGRDTSLVEWFSVSIQNATTPESGSLPLLQLGLALMGLVGSFRHRFSVCPRTGYSPGQSSAMGKPELAKALSPQRRKSPSPQPTLAKRPGQWLYG
jgi:hypothetical protein